MLYLFDLDGTLITSYMDTPHKDYDNWGRLPRRYAILNKLRMQGHSIAIITNQGGAAFGFVTAAQVDAKLQQALRVLGLASVRSDGSAKPPAVYCALHDERGKPPFNDPTEAARRKPSPAMILEALDDYPNAAAQGVLYVGDRPEDEQAAKAAGVPFQWAASFFADDEVVAKEVAK